MNSARASRLTLLGHLHIPRDPSGGKVGSRRRLPADHWSHVIAAGTFPLKPITDQEGIAR